MKFICDYQTIIVGIVGFAGVILTLIVNAKIARKQLETSLLHQRNFIRKGLITELKFLRDTFNDRLKFNNRLRIDFTKHSLFPELIPCGFYKSILSELGKLSLNEIEAVMQAYLLTNEIPIKLRLISDIAPGGQTRDGYIIIPRKDFEHVKNIHQASIEVINKALNSLQEMLDHH